MVFVFDILIGSIELYNEIKNAPLSTAENMHATTTRNNAIFNDKSNKPDYTIFFSFFFFEHSEKTKHKIRIVRYLIANRNAKPKKECSIDEIWQRIDIDQKNTFRVSLTDLSEKLSNRKKTIINFTCNSNDA